MALIIDTKGLRVCQRCYRLTANGGGVCTHCLNGAPAIRIRNQNKNNARPRRSRDTRKYSPEFISRVLDVYNRQRSTRCRGVFNAAAAELGLSRHIVQHLVYYYGRGGQPLRAAPTNLAGPDGAG